MIVRTVKEKEYEALQQLLPRRAHIQPMDVTYTVDLTVDGVVYAMKLLVLNKRRVAVLQACRMDRGHGGQDELIADSGLLNAFLEILLYQSVH